MLTFSRLLLTTNTKIRALDNQDHRITEHKYRVQISCSGSHEYGHLTGVSHCTLYIKDLFHIHHLWGNCSAMFFFPTLPSFIVFYCNPGLFFGLLFFWLLFCLQYCICLACACFWPWPEFALWYYLLVKLYLKNWNTHASIPAHSLQPIMWQQIKA